MRKYKDILFTGFALFAMLFGAGNLIFPPMLGYQLGADWKMASLGFIVTGVGFPLLGLIAAVYTGKELNDFAARVSPLFSKVYVMTLILTIGFFLAMPRTGATAYEMTLQSMGYRQVQYRYLFLALYFFVTWLFSLKANKVVERIGSILTPCLLLILAIIIYRGVTSPYIAVSLFSTSPPAFSKGFVEGYQTMDTLATIVYSAVIMKSIRYGREMSEGEERAFLWKSSLIAILLLALVYGYLSYIGASFTGVFTRGTIVGNTELLVQIVKTLLGEQGTILLGLAVAGACLTTAIGLVATVGDYFSEILPYSYKSIVSLTCIAGFIFANFGVQTIIRFAIPVLMILYPISMVLIFLNLTKNYIKNDWIYRACVGAAIVFGSYQLFV